MTELPEIHRPGEAAGSAIVVNGDLGSGKSTVSVEIARRLGVRRICVGDLYREMARQRNMTALQLNLHAELDDEVDGYVDRLQRDIAGSGQQLVVDSRLAWHFFTDAMKVHLMTDRAVAARRVLGRPASSVESYSSSADAVERLRERSESERTRFLVRYGVDKTRLRNYTVVCDTTSATPEEVVDRVIRCYREPAAEVPALFVDPRRIYPTGPVPDGAEGGGAAPLSLGYTGEHFFVVDGHRRLSNALRARESLVEARLVAEADEPVPGTGRSATGYFGSRVRPDAVHDWAAAHGTTLPVPARS
jgi:predicted cytidylate kinase